MKNPKEDAHTQHPRHKVFSGPKLMSYSISVTSADKNPRNNFRFILYQDE